MALFFNELATNAAKHGALTGANGRVEVNWTQEAEGSGDRRFRLTWAESGGDRAVVAPDRTSFGTLQKLVRRSEEHTSELQSLMRNSYAVFCLKKKKKRYIKCKK